MAELIRGLDAARIRDNLARIRDEVGDGVEILAAVKYVAVEELAVLAEAGVTLVGENRAQALEEKAAAHADVFTWDFIGQLQSRKVKAILPRVRLIHSVATDSALAQVERHAADGTEVLLEVNVAGEPGKGGFAPDALPGVLARCAGAQAFTVGGLMTMPPLAQDPEDSRRWFAALAQLAADHGLARLSMGTSQDYAVAAQEGATIVRIGSTLLR